jgi:hypothetical protein
MKATTRVRRNVLIAAAVVLAGATGAAFAETPAGPDGQWAKTHPRRAEVNARLANQNRRIHQEAREGEISRAQAARLHQQDHAIRREERTMASTNGGHITRTEQRALNQQENQVSREIGR